ncbi:conjugative transposon protein TraM [Arenibacter sp. BSSL-BM3]|uniref:Conjugative transposon protein TraM n=1 Tax=Arenibacter arenosicollis TaxID=2762274 RepID=A0ABR7QR57_9FLAO|nr:conjugative transposon protein TraM [Arenibacter arenosicollis]MBC8769674.1 conjugative transposon protein TraM [Arenibacter arenosicollis]
MKIEKNKIVFTSILLCILLFITAYAVIIMDEGENPNLDINQIPLPELKNEQKIYDSKLDALNDIKEEKQLNVPSVYNDKFLDSTGRYDPDLLNKEKRRMVDSIYKYGRIQYSQKHYNNVKMHAPRASIPIAEVNPLDDGITTAETQVASKELALDHQLFFASHPISDEDRTTSPQSILARVDGTQTVKTDYRLRMRLLQDTKINSVLIPKNTRIYGFVSFKPNRTLIRIENIDHFPIQLMAYDFEDGSEGIYLKNNFRAEATNEVVDDIVDDINITGMPQIKGVQRIFRRNRRNTRATIIDNYKLILKLKKNNPKLYFQ